MVETKDLTGVIAQYPLFRGMERSYLELIAGCASNVRFEEGSHIFRIGDRSDRFYSIRRGKVAIEVLSPQKGPITIQTVGEGEILSWSWLFPPYECEFDARCVTLVRALAFDAKCLREKCEADHGLGYELMKRFSHIMVRRLRATRLQLLDVYANPSGV